MYKLMRNDPRRINSHICSPHITVALCAIGMVARFGQHTRHQSAVTTHSTEHTYINKNNQQPIQPLSERQKNMCFRAAEFVCFLLAQCEGQTRAHTHMKCVCLCLAAIAFDRSRSFVEFTVFLSNRYFRTFT